MFREGFLFFCGGSFGLLSAAGVFTVFSTVGLVPRFAGKTHSAKEIFLYENMIILGTIIGNLVSIWPKVWETGLAGLIKLTDVSIMGNVSSWTILRFLLLITIGLFSGMFVGCMALAIAEMLDSIPIFTRRISFKKGIGIAICSVAAGKLAGSLFFFLEQIYEAVP